MCIADDTKWLFFRIVPPPSAGEQYTSKLGKKRLHRISLYSLLSHIQLTFLRRLLLTTAVIPPTVSMIAAAPPTPSQILVLPTSK